MRIQNNLKKNKKWIHTKTKHIIFDAFCCNRNLINDEDFIFHLILDLAKLIKMRILVGPNLLRDHNKKHPGITGIAIIDYSHISIHTFVKTKEVFLDIFSCRPFDYSKVKKYLLKKLKVKPEHVETIEVKYPWEK